MKRIATVLLVVVSLLMACSGENKPATSEFKKGLSLHLPGYFSLDSFSVEAGQNLGNKVDPVYAVRFNAAVKTMVDLYKEEKRENGVIFVGLVSGKGKKVDIFGKITSTLYQGAWRHNIDIDGNPFASLGTPLTQFSGGRVIISGSEEEKKYYAEIEQKKAEQRKNLANSEKILIGKWRCENILATFKSDGSLYTLWDDGRESISEWRVEGDILIITPRKFKKKNEEWKTVNWKPFSAKILYIDNNRYTTKDNLEGKIWNYTRVQ